MRGEMDRDQQPATGRGERASGRVAPFRGTAITSRTAAEEIARQLRDALISGSIQPGDRLSTEPGLAEEFGVSRATVREAMRILRGQGIIQTLRGARGGHFLVSPQTEAVTKSVGEAFGLWFDAGAVSIAEVDEARNVVERALVRLAAERRTEDDLRAMEEILGEADESQSLTDFLDLDVRFHGQIAIAARNRLLELPMNAIHSVRPRTNRLLRRHDRSAVFAQHSRLYEAIRDGDPDAAEQAFLAHAEYIRREREAAIAAQKRSAREIAVGELPAVSDEEDH